MDEQKLNKKLAEWAGFKLVSGVPVPYYQNPNRQAVTSSNDMPNFTQSLDVCFKWLVPKLDQAQYYEALRSIFSPKENTTALALCLAIEKLIK